MTIVTKPLSEKKEEKGQNQEPLVGEVKVLVPEATASGSGTKKGIYTREQVRHVIKTRILPTYIAIGFLLSLLLIFLIPILATMLKDAVRAKEMYHEWCSIPYEESRATQGEQAAQLSVDINNNFFDQLKKFTHNMIMDKNTEKFFREEFEIDEVSEKITVPDFSGGRRSRFIHDFRTNKTGIIDLEGRRCFVLPLNRSSVLPPDGLMDLVKKMNTGYYDVDTSVLRETMRVVTPAIENRADLGTYIMNECFGYPIYKLEKYVSGVFKRSANNEEGKFTVFSGKGTQELRIINYGDVVEHEVEGPIAMA